MRVYETPGVYYEHVDTAGPAISPIRTDIAGFVGIAERGPLHRPVPIQSWRQFQSWFGGFTGSGYLGYAIRAFFENGGRRCWVVRVASEAAAMAQTMIASAGPLPNRSRWIIEASSPGVWGNDLDVELRETSLAQTISDPRHSSPEYTVVGSLAGFGRATLVRLTQEGIVPVYKVISNVDARDKKLWWIHSSRESRLPYDAPLSGFKSDSPILIESIEYTLIVCELGRLKRVYDRLSLIPEHPHYGPAILPRWEGIKIQEPDTQKKPLASAPESVAIREANQSKIGKPGTPHPAWVVRPLERSAHEIIPLRGGADGLVALTVSDFIGESVSPLESHEAKLRKRRGLQALYEVSEISILAVPDIHIRPVKVSQQAPPPPCVPDPCVPRDIPLVAVPRPKAVGDLPPIFSDEEIFRVQSAMIVQCEALRDRIAVLDPPLSVSQNDQLGIGALLTWRKRFDSKYAALYYPWVKVVDPLRLDPSLVRTTPPSGHVVGQYANTDFQIGVHKAPANVPLIWIQDVTVGVNDVIHGGLNEVGINVIRSFPSRGLRIFGARTISSDTDWRFVNVRRLLMMIEKAIAYSSQWAVFEPNDTTTRVKLHLALFSFLLALWQKGALQGKTQEEAFLVQCNDGNNPSRERDNGRLLAEVRVAPSSPFEFVVLRVGLVNNELEVLESVEAGVGGRGV